MVKARVIFKYIHAITPCMKSVINLMIEIIFKKQL